MPNVSRVQQFTALAEVYRAAGFAEYSQSLGPRLIDIAFEMEWTGRSLLDLGCGTGDAAAWFAERGFRAVGVEQSTAMLRQATPLAENSMHDVQFVHSDIRTYKPDIRFEMVTCMGGTLNYLPTLRDLESTFRVASEALEPDKLFIFDVRTIYGLSRSANADRVLFDNGEDILVLTRSDFSFETLSLTVQYNILRHDGKAGWQRADEMHVLRGYPLQGVIRLLTQAGFKVERTLTPDLEPVGEQHNEEMLLFIVRKESGSA